MLWLLGSGLALALHLAWHGLRHPSLRGKSPGQGLLGIGLALLLAALWGAILLDQLPCFLGFPNCD